MTTHARVGSRVVIESRAAPLIRGVAILTTSRQPHFAVIRVSGALVIAEVTSNTGVRYTGVIEGCAGPSGYTVAILTSRWVTIANVVRIGCDLVFLKMASHA